MGGTTFQRGAAGTLIRVRPLPTKRRTSYTNTERGNWQYLSRWWGTLTGAQRTAWQVEADKLTWTNKFGEVIAGKGYWLFLACNGYMPLVGGTLQANPGVVAPVGVVTGLAAASNVAGGTFTLTWTSGNVPAGEAFLVYSTPPLSGGRSAGFARYRFLTYLNTGTTSGASIFTAYAARHGALPSSAQNVFIRVLPVVKTWGQPGVPVEALTVAT